MGIEQVLLQTETGTVHLCADKLEGQGKQAKIGSSERQHKRLNLQKQRASGPARQDI